MEQSSQSSSIIQEMFSESPAFNGTENGVETSFFEESSTLPAESQSFVAPALKRQKLSNLNEYARALPETGEMSDEKDACASKARRISKLSIIWMVCDIYFSCSDE